MIPIEMLRREHRIILAVLDAAENEARETARRGAFDTMVVGGFMDFFRVFAHGIHHGREEHHLFVLLGRRIASAGQISLVPLLRSHDECRRRLQSIADLLGPCIQGDYWTALSLSDRVDRYCELLRAHIEHEESMLFPIAESVLRPADEVALVKAFQAFTRGVGPEVVHRYRGLARSLARSRKHEFESQWADMTPIHFG